MEVGRINKGIEIEKVEQANTLQLVHQIRHEVFVVEQQVDEALEYEFEDESEHFIAWVNGEPAGTARWRKTESGIKLERFAVLKKFRNDGVGSAILKVILQELPPSKKVYLHAQVPAMSLYEKQGFKPVGELFYEADMPHYKMELKG